MKNRNVVFLLLLIMIIAISCEKDEPISVSSNFRLKMEVLYKDNEAVNKAIYTYLNNRIDSVMYYSNSFLENNPGDFNHLTRYVYNGDFVTEYDDSYMGNMVSSSSQNEYEFENDNIVRYGNQLYRYENGLLVEWTNDTGDQSYIYEYENGNLIRITLSYLRSSEGILVPEQKFEFSYIDNKVEGRRFSYSRVDDLWEISGRVDKYYSNDLCIQLDYYAYYNVYETIDQTDEFSYNEYGDLTQIESHDFMNDEIYFHYYENSYDEYGNLIEVETSSKTEVYYYERGESNIDIFELPADPLSIFYNF